MSDYAAVLNRIRSHPRIWLVTGGAGFIGSNIVQTLLEQGQTVRVLDNFSTGSRGNLEDIRGLVGQEAWQRFHLFEGDICRVEDCMNAAQGAELILHQAALGSVPRSVAEPLQSAAANVFGFLNILVAAKECGISRIVYASSSSVYGDSPQLPKIESNLGKVLSPYAATKRADEVFAEAFSSVYDLELVGLRYFNVFGPRQDPNGAYAAVIPRWISQMLSGDVCRIFGDGETSRDFCFVENVVQANLRAAMLESRDGLNESYNIACGEQLSLNQLHAMLARGVIQIRPDAAVRDPEYHEFRSGDVRHSLADIQKAKTLLGYLPTILVHEGLERTVQWFAGDDGRKKA